MGGYSRCVTTHLTQPDWAELAPIFVFGRGMPDETHVVLLSGSTRGSKEEPDTIAPRDFGLERVRTALGFANRGTAQHRQAKAELLLPI